MSRIWMPLYVGDYLRDTRDLSTLQHGAYLLLIMHYWQHDALPDDDRQLAAIAGLAPAVWRRIGAPVKAKFRDGWKHKRIEAELAKADCAAMQRSRAGQRGGLRSGVARAIAHGEVIIAAQAQASRALKLRGSGREASAQAAGQAERKPPGTNHNQRIISSSLSEAALPSEGEVHAPEGLKPASQWSRQELDALFARRKPPPPDPVGEGPASAAQASDASADEQSGS
jgi:uncharacterized protein YdaU (DUF1376 family)